MGTEIDSEKNLSTIGVEGDISVPSSKVRVLVIPTNEELVIAGDTERVVSEVSGSLS
jgi:acetate kinase